MPRYNVRRDSEPQTVLGTLELPDGLAAGSVVRLPLRSSVVEVELREYVTLDLWSDRKPLHELAVYADVRSLAFWRQIPGFTESEQPPATEHGPERPIQHHDND